MRHIFCENFCWTLKHYASNHRSYKKKMWKLKGMWSEIQISLLKNLRLLKVVLYFLRTSEASRLFQNTSRISRICESVWMSICMALSFHGCQFCVCERAVMFLSNKDLTGLQVVALHWLNVDLPRLKPTILMSLLSVQGESTESQEHDILSWIMSTYCFNEEK